MDPLSIDESVILKNFDTSEPRPQDMDKHPKPIPVVCYVINYNPPGISIKSYRV